MNTNGTHKPPPLTLDPAILASFRQPPRAPSQAKTQHSTEDAATGDARPAGVEDHYDTPASEAGSNPTTETR